MGYWIFPFDKNTITSPYGDKTPPRTSPHRGLDFATGGNDVIRAVTDGVITDIYWSNCLGWVSEQASASGKYRISYCHLNCHKHGANCQGPSVHADGSNCMKNLKVGDKVEVGKTAVGRIGDSGECSRGDHLHLVIGKKHKSAVSGWTTDPEKYIQRNIDRHGLPGDEPQEVTEPIVTVPDCEPEPITPEPTQGIPAKILEAVRTILLWLKK